jgi:hypothetical protein
MGSFLFDFYFSKTFEIVFLFILAPPQEATPPDARNGTIARIAVTNFMCHEKLEMKFEKRINYFTGSNGSGKSAMMTALVVGLGGSSRHVDRGNSAQGEQNR